MMASEVPKATCYDLMIVTDATASMNHYLQSLNQSLPQIIQVSALTGCFQRISVVAYRDYCGGELTEWSGWYYVDSDYVPSYPHDEDMTSRTELLEFASSLSATNGGDMTGAAKTGLAKAYQHMRAEAETIMLLYADASPHLRNTSGTNMKREQDVLGTKEAYGGTGILFKDWASAANTFRCGQKKCKVFSIIDCSYDKGIVAPFLFISARTRGACFLLPCKTIGDMQATTEKLSEITITLLLAWMGIDGGGREQRVSDIVLARYQDENGLSEVYSEHDEIARNFIFESKVEILTVEASQLKEYLQGRPAVEDFAKRYREDEVYRYFVVRHLYDIIGTDVTAMASNPVFGSLWRAVCNDRRNLARDDLVQEFGAEVDELMDQEKKEKMRAWLEESYDYARDILEILRSVRVEDRFPCVYLDPTIKFTHHYAIKANEEEEAIAMGASFTRSELLEIARSCDPVVLRRLGHILTKLSFAETAKDLPNHIASESEERIPRIPMALSEQKHRQKFWKVLLHAVLPGTLLSARPAALLAALSLRMGIKPLQESARQELLCWDDHWNSFHYPETWSLGCMNLLLEADTDVRKHKLKSLRVTDEARSVLTDEDRELFRALVDYKMLELNMETKVPARKGWSPNKTRYATGPTVTCKGCGYSRSVTIMGENNLCGLCLYKCPTEREQKELVHGDDTASENDEKTPLVWVECSVQACRAQYVLYHPQQLGRSIPPKCHYCRTESHLHPSERTQPISIVHLVECPKCLNRIIWPNIYRPASFEAAKFECEACNTNSIQTIVEVETTPKELAQENGSAWLLRNDGQKIPQPFDGRSIFNIISTLEEGTEGFAQRVQVLPALESLTSLQFERPEQAQQVTPTLHPQIQTFLTSKGKPIHNTPELLAAIASWVLSRRTQPGVCTLCFTPHKASHLRAACGRRGCHQKICTGCSTGWYGQNALGRVINAAALNCPFCRRRAAPGYAPGIRGLAAVDDHGAWIYAWCRGCGEAKRFVERVCGDGAPVEVHEWRCEECEEGSAALAATGAAREVERRAVLGITRKCPGCRVQTRKAGGCNHMECAMCRADWCWLCGLKAESAGEIYAHIEAEHGGLYFPRLADFSGEYVIVEGGNDDVDEEEEEDDVDSDSE